MSTNAPSPVSKPERNLLPLICGMAVIYCVLSLTVSIGPSFIASYICVILLSLRSSRTWHTHFAAVLGTLLLVICVLNSPPTVTMMQRIMSTSVVLLTVWGAAFLGSATVHRARHEASRIAELAVNAVQHKRLMAAAEGSNIWLWEADGAGRLIWDLNPPAILGLDDNSDAAARWADFIAHVDPAGLAIVNASMAAAIARKDPQIAQRYKVIVDNGQLVMHFITRGRIYYDANGEPLRIIGATTDVTEEVRRAELLQQQMELQQTQHRRMKIAAKAADLWVWEREANNQTLVWDENRPKEFGMDDVPYDQFLRSFSDLIVPEDVDHVRQAVIDACRSGSERYSARYRTRTPGNNEIQYREANGHVEYGPDGKAATLIGITRNITAEVLTHEMIQREAQLKNELSNRLNVAIETAGMHCWQLQFPGARLVWSQNIAAELGAYASDIPFDQLQAELIKSIHPEDLHLIIEETETAMEQGIESRTFRIRRIMPDGAITHFRIYHRYGYHPDGRPDYVLGVTNNVTQIHQTSAQMREQKEQLELLHLRMERAALSSQEGHWEFDLNTRCHWASESYRALLGYPPDFDLSTLERYHQLVHPADIQLQLRPDLEHLPAGEPFTNVRRMRHANGEWRWMQARGALERDADGKPLRLTGSLRDIHEQKIAEEKLLAAQQRFTRAINGTADGLWEVDLATNNMWLSPRFLQILGLDANAPSTWKGAEIDQLVDPADLPMINEHRQRAYEFGIQMDIEYRIQTKEQGWIWVRTRGKLERDANGKPLRMAGSMSNVTAAHEAREQLIKATEEAHQANRAKSAFLANMSHEIRTPMNGIIGMTGLLLDTELDRMQRDFSETIRSSADSLLGIINDILDFSKIEAGKMDIEMLEMDLRSNVEDVGAMLGFQAASKNLELIVNVHPNVPDRLIGDPQRIRQCLINLVGNALKFTRHGEVVIEVCQVDAARSDNRAQLRFEVRDTGIGLSTDTLTNLFKPFTQADSSTTRKYGGTGLGLSIVKRLVEIMGGEVGATSEQGTGSTFWFTLPLETVAQPAEIPVADDSVSRGKHILIVDDNATNRRVLSLQLEHLGYVVGIASSGAEALEALFKQAALGRGFDLVLSDFQMPDMDGAMLGERINADPRLMHSHLVLLTSMDQHGDTERFAAMGFAAYLTKPIRMRELRDCLQRVLAHDAATWRAQAQPLITLNAIHEQTAAERFDGKVLLVDDNIVNQKVAGRFLERMGLTVFIASDGAEAVSMFEQDSFDIVFMDLQMPVMDGFEATRRIRDFEGWRPRTPIVALTANAMMGQMERCLASGMDGFITKPIHVEQLREIVAKHCHRPAVTAVASELDGKMTEALLENAAADQTAMLDIDRFKAVADGDMDFVRELAQAYIDSAQHTLAEIKAAVARNDRDSLARAAHKLKGASSNVYAERIRDVCELLEQHAGTLTSDVLNEKTQQLEHMVASITLELNALIKGDQSAA